MKKCPLCGGKLEKNYCDSCGYAVPDEEDISALYNYDPSDYPAEEPIREITPEHITEEIYPNRPKPVELKVREETEEKPFVNPYADMQGQNVQPQNTPAQNAPAQNTPPSPQNPYAGSGNFTPYTNSSTGGDEFAENMKKFWWVLLIAFFAPFLGIIFAVLSKNNFDKKFKSLIIAAAVAGFILPP